MLSDEQIDVRKAASELVFYIGKLKMVKSKASLNHNIKKMLVSLGQSSSWEGRHGMCLALSSYCRHKDIVSHLNSLEEILDAFSEQIHQKHIPSGTQAQPDHRLGVAATSNACASLGMTDLFIAYHVMKTASEREGDSEALSTQMENSLAILGKEESRKLSPTEELLSSLFADKIEPQIEFFVEFTRGPAFGCGGDMFEQAAAQLSCIHSKVSGKAYVSCV